MNTLHRLGSRLPNPDHLPNPRPVLPSGVRQNAKVRQLACLTSSPLNTPVNKGDSKKVRQLGRLGSMVLGAEEGRRRQGIHSSLPNRLTADQNSANTGGRT